MNLCYYLNTTFYLILSTQAAEAFNFTNFQFISCLDIRNETMKIMAGLEMTLVSLLNLNSFTQAYFIF